VCGKIELNSSCRKILQTLFHSLSKKKFASLFFTLSENKKNNIFVTHAGDATVCRGKRILFGFPKKYYYSKYSTPKENREISLPK
jgi:hypothetical protein